MYNDYRSKSLTQLTQKFLDLLSKNSSDNPFQKNWIIVQNREMQQWLSLSFAKKYKIAANNEFIFPSELIWKLYRAKSPKLDLNLPSDIIPLQWSIFEVLQKDKQLQSELFGNRDYNPKIILQLSKSIADVFDLYQFFRPDMLNKWNSGGVVYQERQEQWQANLWNKLCKEWKSNEGISTRVEAYNNLKDWLTKGDFPFEDIPENVWMFGIPQVTNPISEIYTILSKSIHCYHFAVDTSVDSQNSDLNTFNNKLLNAVQNRNEVWRRSLDKHNVEVHLEEDDQIDASEYTKLDQIQRMLLNEPFVTSDENDRSISINSCHSKKREVEVLKDSILEAMNTNLELKAEEVLILVPNLDDYRSHLNESFVSDIVDQNIPINLGFSDHTDFRESTFLNLIGLLNSDFKVN
jgi:exodeoxyribonuclease V gamma subunit